MIIQQVYTFQDTPFTSDGTIMKRGTIPFSKKITYTFTVPGGKVASAHIAKHMHYQHGAYFGKDDKKVSWDLENLNKEIKGNGEDINDTIDPALIGLMTQKGLCHQIQTVTLTKHHFLPENQNQQKHQEY